MSFSLIFHGDLANLLRRQWRGQRLIRQACNRPASIKDVIESFGLPHTEVGRLVVGGEEVDFSFQPAGGLTIDIYPVPVPWNVQSPSILRPYPLTKIAFVVDVNVGKLAPLLRMTGFDAACDQRWDDAELASVADREKRILLSRDRGLLSRKKVIFGRYVRAEEPGEQLREIITLLDLGPAISPFSRCMKCNGILRPVARKDIISQLQPLTRKYYNTFSRCEKCGQIYWPGSHLEKMKNNFPDLISSTCFSLIPSR